MGFTGGEPLLRLNLIEELGRTLRDSGLPWGLTTGVGWSKSEQVVDRTLNVLVSAGIHNITVSVDEAHLKGRDPRIAEYFVSQLVKSGVFVTVSCTSGEEIPKVPIPIPKANNIKVEYHYISPVGYATGKKIVQKRLSLNQSHCPMSEGLTLSVWPDGFVYPCCSTYIVNKEKNLAIGNVHESSLGEILLNALKDKYLCAIREIGFSGLICLTPNSEVWKKVMDEPLLDACHLCSKVSAIPEALKEVRETLSRYT